MIDKNDGVEFAGLSLCQEEYRRVSDCGGVVLSPRASLNPADGTRQLGAFCGAILGVLFASNVCAETETMPKLSSGDSAQISIQIDQPVVLNDTPGVVLTVVAEMAAESYANAANQSENPLSEHQAVLQTASLQYDNAESRTVAENSGQGEGISYAILSAMVALIAMVPVARRNGDF